MAQGQQRGRPRRALSAGRFLAEEVPFKLRLGQFLEECWWGKPRGKGEQGGSGNLLMAQELGERTGGGGGLVRIWSGETVLRASRRSCSFSLQVDCVPRLDRHTFTLLGLLVQLREGSGPRGARRGTGHELPPWLRQKTPEGQISVCGVPSLCDLWQVT